MSTSSSALTGFGTWSTPTLPLQWLVSLPQRAPYVRVCEAGGQHAISVCLLSLSLSICLLAHHSAGAGEETTRVPRPRLFFASPQKRKKYILKISNRMKKISYEPRRNFLQPQIVKNLLRKWSRFCKDIL
jgi:hypothetical protein